MPQARRRAQAAASDRKVTRRMVLERVRVREFNDEGTSANGPDLEAWVERGIFEGDQRTAINAFAGKPGTAEARVGVFKAPALTSWKGGVRNVAPPVPLVQQESLDDLLPERSDA